MANENVSNIIFIQRRWDVSPDDRARYDAFKAAAEAGNVDEIHRLHTIGVRQRDLDIGMSTAASRNNIGLMHALRALGADNFDAAAEGAAQRGKLEAVQLLISWMDPTYIYETLVKSFILAEENGHTEIADYLNRLMMPELNLDDN